MQSLSPEGAGGERCDMNAAEPSSAALSPLSPAALPSSARHQQRSSPGEVEAQAKDACTRSPSRSSTTSSTPSATAATSASSPPPAGEGATPPQARPQFPVSRRLSQPLLSFSDQLKAFKRREAEKSRGPADRPRYSPNFKSQAREARARLLEEAAEARHTRRLLRSIAAGRSPSPTRSPSRSDSSRSTPNASPSWARAGAPRPRSASPPPRGSPARSASPSPPGRGQLLYSREHAGYLYAGTGPGRRGA